MKFKLCRGCNLFKNTKSFGPHKQCKDGLNSRCKQCCRIKSKKDYAATSTIDRLYSRAKRRARIKNLEFTISKEHIIVPALCPVFKVPMIGRYAPSLDRCNSSKGYTPDNIMVISTRANTLKNNASIKELEILLNYLIHLRDNQSL